MGRTTDEPERGAGPKTTTHDGVAHDRDDWMLVVDVREFDDHYVIRAELPGVAAEDIKVAVEDGVLLLTGERPRIWHEPQSPHPGACCQRHFARSISLPFDAVGDRFEITRKSGAVEVRFAKLYAPAPDTPHQTSE